MGGRLEEVSSFTGGPATVCRPHPASRPFAAVLAGKERECLMFQLSSPRKGSTCDGASRRDFLKVGTLGVGGLLLADLLRSRAAASAQGQPTRNTSVVWLWLGGGPTHIETFDPKMSAPAEFRSVVGAVPTSLPGVEFGGVFPELAQRADKLAVVRSFAHTNS